MTTRKPIKRTLALLACLSLWSGSLVACDGPPATQSGEAEKSPVTQASNAKRYTHETLGFSITFPESWDVQKNFETFAFIGVSPQEGDEDVYGENVNVVAQTTPPDMSLEEFSTLMLGRAREGLEEYARRGESFEDINGVRAARFDYVHTIQEIRIVSITFILIKNNIAYAINCSATMEDYDRYRETMLQIARTFRLEE